MQSTDVVQGMQDVNIQYASHSHNAPSDWEVPLQEVAPIVNICQEKEMDCMYYPYNGPVNSLNNQEQSSWNTVLTGFGNTQNVCCNNHNQVGGDKKDIGQHTVVSAEDTRCAQLGCSNISNSQDINGYSSVYFSERSDNELQRHHQSNIFLPECDLAKLPELTPDIISLEGDVDSELLKVVDSEDDEEDLIVDDSETESEISVSDAGSCVVQSHLQSELHCIVCGLPRSHTVEANFFHIDNTFPLTYVTKTPIIVKLVDIAPSEIQPKLNFGENLICRRCFNLIDTAENLEIRLISVRKEICDYLARTQRNNTPLIDSNQRNTQCYSSILYNGREIPPYGSSTVFEGTLRSELPTHITTSHTPRYSLTDSQYLNSRASSCMFSSSSFDQRCMYVQNNSPFTKLYLHSNSYANSFHQQEYGTAGLQYSSQCLSNKDTSNITTSHDSSEKDIPSNRNSEDEKELVETSEKVSEEEEELKVTDLIKENIKDKVKIKSEDGYQCDRCGRTYTEKFKLMHHLRKHDGNFRFKCEYCSKGYTVRQNLLLHLRSHKNIRPYLCNRCPASFFNEEELQGHVRVCNDKMFPCDKCTKIFISEQKLNEHKDTSHNNRIIEIVQTKKYECEICKKSFRFPTDLRNHSISHKDVKSNQCNICGKSYKHKRHLNRHLRVFHKNESLEKVQNKNSKVIFPPKMDLKKIKEIVANRKKKNASRKKNKSIAKTSPTKSVCPICNKAVWKLNTHLISHSNTKGFKCSLCDVEFTLKQGLERHLRHKHPGKNE